MAGPEDGQALEVAIMNGFDWLMIGGFIDYWEEDEGVDGPNRLEDEDEGEK